MSIGAPTRQEAHYTELLLAECTTQHLGGLVDLLRFGIASSGTTSEACVAAAWLLNSARFAWLPTVSAYRRTDGSGFRHCDGDWLERKAKIDHTRPLTQQFVVALRAVGAQPRIRRADQVDALDPSVLLLGSSIALVLARNTRRGAVFVCRMAEGLARLEWLWLSKLPKGDVASLPRDPSSPVARADAEARGGAVVYLDSPEGLGRLSEAEGLANVAYASLHGHTQRDLSSCQVASLSSVALKKGTRARLLDRAAELADRTMVDTQGTLRALAVQHVARKGHRFDYRGLSIAELGEVAERLGLKVEVVETKKATSAELEKFRTTARQNLGRIIVNFSRPTLQQPGSGHHSVLVAYHPASDSFLVDDPAGFKVPPFWVSAAKLLEAMATFDATEGVQQHRGYVVIEPRVPGEEEEVSSTMALRPSSSRS